MDRSEHSTVTSARLTVPTGCRQVYKTAQHANGADPLVHMWARSSFAIVGRTGEEATADHYQKRRAKAPGCSAHRVTWVMAVSASRERAFSNGRTRSRFNY